MSHSLGLSLETQWNVKFSKHWQTAGKKKKLSYERKEGIEGKGDREGRRRA